jgi:serine/threonine-protein kinase
MTDDGLSPGDLLAGRYRLIDRLGAGGMAVIWRAHDETLDRLVAVKVLDLTLNGDARTRDLVRREAWAAARLNHPDVASVHDFVHLGHFGVLVMQLVSGEPLADTIAAGPLPWGEALRIASRVALVLDHAHHRGVVHRDITPDNIVVDGDRVTVLDFGIAARIGEPDDDGTGASFGTPAYVAPERLDGTPAQTATDVYALGVVLFEMLTSRVPFKIRNWDDLALEPGPVPALPINGLPGAVGDLVRRMLARDPAARPRAAEVAAVLGQALRPRRSLAAPALVTAGAAAVAAAFIWWPAPAPQVAATLPTSTPRPTATTGPSASQSVAPQPTPALTRDTALHAVLSTISDGVAKGQIRPDAGLDLQQLVQNARATSDLDGVQQKITTREREGAISAGAARELKAAVAALAATMV